MKTRTGRSVKIEYWEISKFRLNSILGGFFGFFFVSEKRQRVGTSNLTVAWP